MPEVDVAAARAVIEGWLSEASASGEHDQYGSKREHMRYTWDRPLELLANDEIHYVYSRDISASGIGLTCKFTLRAGSVVFVRGEKGDPWIRCRVAHATPTIGAYRVGVELVFDLD